MDEHFLPDVRNEPARSAKRRRAVAFHALLHSWLDVAPGRIANRPFAMASNMSKTYQAAIIRQCGFDIPETLVTNDPDEALRFIASCREQGDEVIYKSVSGARSIVQTFGEPDRERLHRIRWCPTQFQRRVRGQDIRVHVVGRTAIAVAVRSDATDYRYARRQTGADAELELADISESLARACRNLSDALELPFCGIDLRRTPQGEHVCFEVNPSPAYSYYESVSGAPIARTLVHWLAEPGSAPHLGCLAANSAGPAAQSRLEPSAYRPTGA
jgi:glutathione synthase/RimK-type ligase-like ATP-grasp enzyme